MRGESNTPSTINLYQIGVGQGRRWRYARLCSRCSLVKARAECRLGCWCGCGANLTNKESVAGCIATFSEAHSALPLDHAARARRESGCRKSVAVRPAIADQKSTSSRPNNATPIRSVDESPVSRPKSRPATAFSSNILPSSGKISSPLFDERQLGLDVGFVFIQAPLRAKCFMSLPITD